MKYYWSINKVPFYFFLFLYLIYTSWSKLLLDFKDLKYKWSTLNNFFCKWWLLFECVHLTKWYQYIFSTSSKVWSILHHRPVGQGHVIKMLPLMLSYTFQVFFCFSKKNFFFFLLFVWWGLWACAFMKRNNMTNHLSTSIKRRHVEIFKESLKKKL